MQKNLKISLFGKSFTIATTEDENIVVQAVDIVNELINNKTQKGILHDDKMAVVVALELAVDLAKQRTLLQSYEDKSLHLNSLLTKDES
ncbi:MAG: cell division protein ZapA [bacterium]